MRKLSMILLGLLIMGSLFALDSNPSNQVKVYYFHTSYRCVNCTNFEKWTQEVINERFQAEVDTKGVLFESINIEEAPNKKYVDNYQLVTKSVVLAKLKNDEEVQWKNLDKIWIKVRNEAKFKDYIEQEIRLMIKGAAE